MRQTMQHGYLRQTGGKVLIFTPKAPIFRTTEFSYINFSHRKQIFVFWAGQNLKLRRNICFRGIKSSLMVNFHVPKPEKVGSLKNVKFKLLSFKRFPHGNDFWPISLGDLNIILGAWNCFSENYRESCDRFFS